MKNRFRKCKNVKTGKYELLAILIFLFLVSVEMVFIEKLAFFYYHFPLCIMFAYISGRIGVYLYNKKAWG